MKSYSEAGATIRFDESHKNFFSDHEIDGHIARVDDALAALGRSPFEFFYQQGWTGSLPSFNRNSYRNGDLDDETAVISGVVQLLSEEL